MKETKSITNSIAYFILVSFIVTSGVAVFTGCSSRKNDPRYIASSKSREEAQYLVGEGNYFLNAGKLDLAEDRLKKALKKLPNMLTAINSLGIVYLNKRQFKKAKIQFERVISINDNMYDAYNCLGVIYMELGDYNRSKECLLRAANAVKYHTPENAYANLAMLEIKHKRYDAALRYVEKGLMQNPDFPPLCNLLGIIYENKGKYDEAIVYYEKAVSVLTEPEVSHLINMGRVYSKMGQKNKALDILEKALGKSMSEAEKKQIRAMIKEVEK